jgi:hypothetical protein
MSDRPDVQTSRNMIRAQLAAAFPGNPRLQRAFENMADDVTATLPDAIAAAIEAASDASTMAQAAAVTALGLAAQALARDEGPPMLPAAAAPADEPPLLQELFARVACLEREVATLKEGPTP